MAAAQTSEYRVLARTYRPGSFAELIGQDALVRTLTNAMAEGRLAHAFILTGVRGVGKTTTARIIARALNCVGPDGQGGPTPEPCGACAHCLAIGEDRHLDVIEMDAASRTGVDDIRELIEGVRYAPVSGRYKVYIVDEVHMLSKNAFNALLKTLEEPPPHVKFVFATTEARKVPVTVLSRCQRFDLRRVGPELMSAHLEAIIAKEGVSVEADALALIVRAAEGSVRDALSLLDQAIAHGAGTASAELVRDMMGLADRLRVLDLYELLMGGELARALESLGAQYRDGADPAAVLQDMLELTHMLTRLRMVPDSGEDLGLDEGARRRSKTLADKLAMPALARNWQMLLKGLDEVRRAPAALAAAEMVLVRLACAAELPSPADLVRDLTGSAGTPAPVTSKSAAGTSSGGGARAALEPAPEPLRVAESAPVGPPSAALPESFEALVALIEGRREPVLYARLVNFVHLVHFEPGRLEFRPAPGAPRELAGDLARKLEDWTGARWVVSVSREAGAPTLAEQTAAEAAARKASAEQDPAVRAVLERFPGAELVTVRSLAPATGGPGAEDPSPNEEP